MQDPLPCARRRTEGAETWQRTSEELLRRTKVERQNFVQQWKDLCRFLEIQKEHVLQWLEGLAADIVKGLEDGLSGTSAQTHLPCRNDQSGSPQVVPSSDSREGSASPAVQDSFLEVELSLRHFSARKPILDKALSSFKELLKSELRTLTGSRTTPASGLAAVPPKQGRAEVNAGEVLQGLLMFEDLAVHFTEEEWSLLDGPQRTLYREVMRENYGHTTALVLELTKPDVISQLEEMEELCAKDVHHSKEKPGTLLSLDTFSHLDQVSEFWMQERGCGLEETPSRCAGVAERVSENKEEKLQLEDFELAGVNGTLLRNPEEVIPQLQEEEGIPETLLRSKKAQGRHLGKIVHKTVIFVGLSKNVGHETQEVCSVCGKGFNNRANLVRHKRIHTGEKSHTCMDCGKSFHRRTNLITHQRIHTGEKPYKCADCGKSFSLSSGLVRHQRIHTGEKPYQCSVCERRFNQKPSLAVHERIHRQEKPYKCSLCEKSYSHVTGLIAHEKIHCEEKLYKCRECEKRFHFSSQLITHQRIHATEKPYKCSVCERGFSWPSGLIVHERIHTGEKPYKCTKCEKSFLSNSNLIRHQLTHSEEKLHMYPDRRKSTTLPVGRIHTRKKQSQCANCETQFSLGSDRVLEEIPPRAGKSCGRPNCIQLCDIKTGVLAQIRTEGTAFRQGLQPLHYQINYIGWE